VKATFEFVEPFDLLLDILGKKLPCALEVSSKTGGVVVLDEPVSISGVVLRQISVEPRYEGSPLNKLLSGDCVNVNGSAEGIYVTGLVCPPEHQSKKV
jgi:hypothetical protein